MLRSLRAGHVVVEHEQRHERAEEDCHDHVVELDPSTWAWLATRFESIVAVRRVRAWIVVFVVLGALRAPFSFIALGATVLFEPRWAILKTHALVSI